MIDSTLRTAALALQLTFDPVAIEQLIDGSPQTGYAELEPLGAGEVGVWEMTAGAMSDTEADELFVVIAGSAEVEFVDTGEKVAYGVGDIGRLKAGQRTIWRVADRIRKVYITPPAR